MNWRITLFVPAIALGIGAFWLQTREGPGEPSQPLEPAPVAVRVTTVSTSEVTTRLSGYGRVMPRRTWEAVSQVDGRVVETFEGLAEGVVVPSDATVLAIDARDYEIARDRAAANLDTAKAQLAELRSQESNTGEQIALERRIEEVLQGEVDRIERLIENGTSARASLEQPQRELITQQRRVLDLEHQLALFPVQRVSAEATIRTRTVELEEAERDLSNVVIKTPFEARVAAADAELGEYVRVGQSLLSLNGMDAADIIAEVQPEDLRAALRLLLPNLDDLGASVLSDPAAANRALSLAGIEATVLGTLNGQTDRWPAEIVRIDGSIDSTTGTLGIVVRVDDPQRPDPATMRPPLANGTFVEVVFTGTAKEPAIALPRSAVFDDIERPYVYVVDDSDALARRSVTLGGRIAGHVIVDDGLDEGDRVLLAAPQPAILGMRLAPVADGALR